MAIENLRQMIDAELEGRTRFYGWRKTPSQTTTAGHWFDLSMSPGNPAPKYWFDAPPRVAKAVSQSQDGGIYHGGNVSPQKKYLRMFRGLASNAGQGLPLSIFICDYLLYYPSCDDSTTDPQILDNTVTLPRHADGNGVMILPVSVAARTGGQSFYLTYTNSEGVSGRVSQTVTQNAASAVGTILCGSTSSAIASTPFVGLQSGDSGVRSIDSVVMLGADVGLFSLILVKPLGFTCFKENTAPYEKDFFLQAQELAEVQDDAFIGMVGLPQGTLAATVLTGAMKVIFG